MNNFEHRVTNGLLKAGLTVDEAVAALNRDIFVEVPPDRLAFDDLWPCIWALVSVLERQFTGSIHVTAPLRLTGPRPLSSRVRLATSVPGERAIHIVIGGTPQGSGYLFGDAGASAISIKPDVKTAGRATPFTGFALAGYLGFAALAEAMGLPQNKSSYVTDTLTICNGPLTVPADGLSIVGLGQLGQSYLSLLYFLRETHGWNPDLFLIDRDQFGCENEATQILLLPEFLGRRKAETMEGLMRRLGFHVQSAVIEIDWEWRLPADQPKIGLLGLDNMPTRRMCLTAGFERVLVGGVGASFREPRVSWHSLPGERRFAQLFPDARPASIPALESRVNSEVRRGLEDTPGRCGWLTFDQVAAAAPSMGLVTAAFGVQELLLPCASATAGSALLWSQLMPVWRERIR